MGALIRPSLQIPTDAFLRYLYVRYRRVQTLGWADQILGGFIPPVRINSVFFTHERRAILPDRRMV